MADITIKKIDDFENYGGKFYLAGKGLGVSAWGMNIGKYPPNHPDYPNHDHAGDGQEEVYIILEGSAELEAGAEKFKLEKGDMARVGAKEKRKIIAGDQGLTMLTIGGTPGKAYKTK